MRRLLHSSVFAIALLALSSGAIALFGLPRISTSTEAPVTAEHLPVAATASPLPPAPVVASPVRFLFFGDIMLGRHVETLMNANGDEYPFQLIEPFMTQMGLVMANLEGPIVSDHAQTPEGSFVFSFKPSTGALLKKVGIDAVSLANNHTLNQGNAGFLETEQNLDAAGIKHTGQPYDASDRYVLHTTVNNMPITIAGFNMTFSEDDPDQAVATVAELRKASAEPIIVFMHWGTEYALHSTVVQEALAHKLIDAGASAIIGAHPHVVEEVENYKGHMIFYSLGNFIFDQYFSTDTQQELAVSLSIDGDAWNWTVHPLKSVLSQPQVMDDADAAAFIKVLQDRSPTVTIAADGTVQ